jgi:hypothetical protein
VKVEMKLSSNPRLTPRHEVQLDEYNLPRLLQGAKDLNSRGADFEADTTNVEIPD